jgi:hypothetical protein
MDVDTAPDKGCALSDRKDRARFGRTNAKCIWGVSDPRRAGRGAKKGAAQIGVAHAPTVALLGCDSGADRRPAAQSAAARRREAADGQEDIGVHIVRGALPAVYARTVRVSARGTVLPSFGSPTLFSLSIPDERNQGRQKGDRVTVRPMGATADRAVDGEAAL